MIESSEKPRVQLSAEFDDALKLAHDLHRQQLRKGGDTPYVAHLLAVTALVLEHGGDEQEAIAALLHDAVEDAGGAPALTMIRDRFGERVATLVEDCSDTDQAPKPPWRPRKEKYIAHLAEASPSALLIAGADRLHNLRSLLADLRRDGERTWSKFNAPKKDQLWLFHSIVEAMRNNPGHRAELLSEIEEVLTSIKRVGAPESRA